MVGDMREYWGEKRKEKREKRKEKGEERKEKGEARRGMPLLTSPFSLLLSLLPS
jgi:hypothetical protein